MRGSPHVPHRSRRASSAPPAWRHERATPIACNLNDADLAARAEVLRTGLFASAEARREIDAGYAFRFPNDGGLTDRLLAFIASERHCCSFFRIELVFEPALGPIWLRLTGPGGVQPFIRATFAGATAP